MKMTADDVQYWAKWKVHTGGPPGKWHVARHIYDGKGSEEARGASGRVRYFNTRSAALIVANRLNARRDPDAGVRLAKALALLSDFAQ